MREERKNISHRNIYATSDRGNYFSGAVIVLLWILLGLSVSVFLLSIIVVAVYTPAVFDYWIVVPVSVALFGLAYSLFFIVKIRRHKKEIEEALTDAVPIDVYIRKADVGFVRSLFLNGIYIEAEFSYNNEKRTLLCGTYVKGKFRAQHFRWFERYCDQRIQAMYSPKTDRILFLKPNPKNERVKEIKF